MLSRSKVHISFGREFYKHCEPSLVLVRKLHFRIAHFRSAQLLLRSVAWILQLALKTTSFSASLSGRRSEWNLFDSWDSKYKTIAYLRWRLLQSEMPHKSAWKPRIPLIQDLEQLIPIFRLWINEWTVHVKNRDGSTFDREKNATAADDQMPDGSIQLCTLRRDRTSQWQ